MTVSIRKHLQNLWRGHYSTRRAVIYLVLGILVLPIVLLLSVILLGYIFKVSTGLDVPGAPVGMAIWFPVLAYLIVAAMGVWRSANNQEAEFRAAGVKHPLAPILAKLLALFCRIGCRVGQAQIEAFEDTWHWIDEAERAFDEVIPNRPT